MAALTGVSKERIVFTHNRRRGALPHIAATLNKVLKSEARGTRGLLRCSPPARLARTSNLSVMGTTQKVTLHTLASLKARGLKAVLVTAYDYPTATFADRAGVDALLVGDSAAMTMLGLPNTLGIGLPEMLVFAKAVSRAARRALVIGDMPFLSYQPSDETAVRSAGAFIGEAGCDVVKCEGGLALAPRIRAMTDAGIAVMGHLGLTPQRLGQLGGYRVQGKSAGAAEHLGRDARILEDAGAFAILLEAVPAETAAYVREQVRIPVYGIGAGPDVDGQLIISHDLLGNFVGDIQPRFVRRYAQLGGTIEQAFRAYAEDVRATRFPGPEHCYPIEPCEAAEIRERRLARAASALAEEP